MRRWYGLASRRARIDRRTLGRAAPRGIVAAAEHALELTAVDQSLERVDDLGAELRARVPPKLRRAAVRVSASR